MSDDDWLDIMGDGELGDLAGEDGLGLYPSSHADARCPDCLSTVVEVLGMHSRTGVHTYECKRCYSEFRI